MKHLVSIKAELDISDAELIRIVEERMKQVSNPSYMVIEGKLHTLERSGWDDYDWEVAPNQDEELIERIKARQSVSDGLKLLLGETK